MQIEVNVVRPNAQSNRVRIKGVDGWQWRNHLPQNQKRNPNEAVEMRHLTVAASGSSVAVTARPGRTTINELTTAGEVRQISP
jgi:hypothetical protein